MSTSTIVPLVRLGPSGRGLAEPPTPFFVRWLFVLLDWSERRRQRKALAELAEDARLLADIGLTREQALGQTNLPFWPSANAATKSGGDQWPNR